MFCGKCGQENADGVRFCTACGVDLSTQTPRRVRGDEALDGETIAAEPIGPGTVLAGRYKILEKAGSGGMGEVWKAEDGELGIAVAVKVLPMVLARNQPSVAGLKREAAISLRLAHPHVCRLHDFHADADTKFLVMEFISGCTLEAILAAQPGRRLPWEMLEPIARHVAAALDYAHDLRPPVLHRDVKPSNIMVASDGTAKVLDFGIARELKDSVTRVTGRETTGTLLYMSPEQYSGKDPTPASDIYSLAATLYECLAGHPPFYRGAIGHQLLHAEPPPIQGLADHMNAALHRALAKTPERRPRSAADLVALLASAPPPVEVVETPDEIAAVTAPVVPVDMPLEPEPPRLPLTDAAVSSSAAPEAPRRRALRPVVLVLLVLVLGGAACGIYFVALPAIQGLLSSGAGDAKRREQAAPVREVAKQESPAGKREEKIAQLLAAAKAEKDDAAAVAKLDELLKVDPANAEARRMRDAADRRVTIGKLLAAAKANDGREKAEAAMKAIDEILRLDPAHAEALRMQARVKALLGPAELAVPGEYRTIQAAIDAARPGDAVRIKAGTYDESLILKDGVRLIGEGYDRVTIRSDGSRADVLLVRNCSSGLVTGLTLQHAGAGASGAGARPSPLQIVSSTVEVFRCRIASAAGSGISITGACSPLIHECLVEGSALDGIRVGDDATPIINDNIAVGSGHHGIAYGKRAGGTAQGNTCKANQWSGIAVTGAGAAPSLVSNVCTENLKCGIYFGEGAAGIAQGGTCDKNKDTGILVLDAGTAPTLKDNVCSGNEQHGICFAQGAGGTADGNTCSNNKSCGIAASGDGTAPALRRNKCNSNGRYGIEFWRGASPKVAADNTAAGNPVGQIQQQ